jgi:hypothetical protein
VAMISPAARSGFGAATEPQYQQIRATRGSERGLLGIEDRLPAAQGQRLPPVAAGPQHRPRRGLLRYRGERRRSRFITDAVVCTKTAKEYVGANRIYGCSMGDLL